MGTNGPYGMEGLGRLWIKLFKPVKKTIRLFYSTYKTTKSLLVFHINLGHEK